MTHFADRLIDAIRSKGTPLVVGLDPRFDQLPAEVVARNLEQYGLNPRGVAAAIEEFCVRVLDVVSVLVPAVKLQVAFFERFGPPGMQVFYNVSMVARRKGLLVISDAKRGDIGSTAEAYADGWLRGVPLGAELRHIWDVDAMTINPLFGTDGIEPFARAASDTGKGLFIIVRSSNPSAGELQDLVADGRPVFMHLADHVRRWGAASVGPSGFSALGAVVGATGPEQCRALRDVMPETFFLVPGYGAQGGSAADTAGAFRADGLGAVINSSRAILFAYSREPYADRFPPDRWQEAVAAATRDAIADIAAHTPAGKLT